MKLVGFAQGIHQGISERMSIPIPRTANHKQYDAQTREHTTDHARIEASPVLHMTERDWCP
jgi:hypothetical protein